jgi:hypothetical protein
MSELLERLRQLIQQDRHDEALGMCDEIVTAGNSGESARGWRLRSYVHRCMNRHDLAVTDASAGLAIDPHNLALLLDRAASLIELGEFAAANCDLELLLETEKAQGGVFFEATAEILHAICLTYIGEAERALGIGARLGDDSRMWALGKLWSRDKVIELARSKTATSR